MTTVADLKGQTVAFAASGGLDSCTVTRWLTDHGVKVVCFTADIAQPDETDFGTIETRMRACGAADYVAVPLHDMIAESGVEVLQFQARYEGAYWNTTGIGRHVIVAGIVPEMKKRGIKVLGHGATGRGNDQVRFQLCTNMLAPEFGVYAPWRDQAFLSRFRGRSEMIDYCNSHKLPITASKSAPYSTDANLLGLTHEAGKLEHLTTDPWFVTPGMGVLPKDAPDAPEVATVRFEKGRPVSFNGKKTTAFQAIQAANAVGGKHGVGICSHLVENRFVGIKSRGVYEAPGMELLGTAYSFLLQLVLDRRSRELFDQLSLFVSKQIYQGYGFDLGTHMARSALAPINALATGTIAVKLYKGRAEFESASDVPHQLYSEANASMEAIGAFDHADSEGFLRVLQVSARALAANGQVAAPAWAAR
ncbi:argininosuccinate synthase : Argininosuccinate synthase OS=Isosphaera pallida (strain ATCC 43644 / DSM 9630 / IS1B) GN=Isop_2909 PE=4 SV=1: Arginosuc_synth [Gemmataceae bacterium]|nr:argininosuccinate synthase : Argininosuccinate synthase OS=Isosphaera pallida (strain ATCC 43644 / DSM 9630 / IS1B) GN=Isop_2909 PE=4 SV=1: Arginosuc_synth [Gemmataceae bacterium]VTU01085.1 argininosuccinate synthase : Argininosuccinate synthase OS=Isosphaera pallida (strain ATCC 43644 / DSM 9630 / IS1B) GN=Isop_2909 PE=4 SV=1: Arginosuc_synth [Gemmataceae bacterium]